MARYVTYRSERLPEAQLDSPDISKKLELAVARHAGGLVVRQATADEVVQALMRSAVILGEKLTSYKFKTAREPTLHVDRYFPSLRPTRAKQVDIHCTSVESADVDIVPLTPALVEKVVTQSPHPEHLDREHRLWFDDGFVDADKCLPIRYWARIEEGDSIILHDAFNYHAFKSVGGSRQSEAVIYGAQLPTDYDAIG